MVFCSVRFVVQPSGTVTLLFTDIEGSTRAWEAYPAEMQVALARHDEVLRDSIVGAGGYVFKTVGDAFCAAFADTRSAAEAAVSAQKAVANEQWPEQTPIRVRMALHTGECEERDGDYFGPTVNRVARLLAVGHGGQTLVSGATGEVVRDRLPASVSLRDLGEHRLKDLGRPEHVFQLDISGIVSSFPALRSLDNPQLLHNLPEQLTSFVGRDRELDELRELVQSSRLVTLTGPGGVGKTRLALQVAAELLDGSGDGVWLVDLAPLANAEFVEATAATALGVREDAGRPMLETLVDALRDRDMLVLFDNCEHVIDATAKVADALLRSCPRVELLATSREPLGVAGESVFRVPSLSLADDALDAGPETLATSEAVRLFLERAAQHKSGFVLDATNAVVVARMCRRLDGIPLAIELAAARLRSVSLDEIDARLDQRFRLLTGGVRTALPRQQTLQALMDWSYDLLTGGEQTVLVRLAVFAGGWDLEAVEAVAAGGEVPGWEVLHHLSALVDKSLVQADDTGTVTRYRLLETVRDYATNKLADRPDDESAVLRTAHRDHYLALAETAAPHLISYDQLKWLGRLETEQDNFRAALARCLVDPDPEPGLRLASALGWLWEFRGYVVEGIETLAALLARPQGDMPGLQRGRALAAVAGLLNHVGDYGGAIARGDEALGIGRAERDDTVTAEALLTLAYAHIRHGEVADALAMTSNGLALARALNDTDLTAKLLNRRAHGLILQGDESGARTCLQEGLHLYRETGNRIDANGLLVNLSVLELIAGERHEARDHLTEAHAIAQAQDHLLFHVFTAQMLGLVEFLDGDHPAARQLFTQSLNAARRIGHQSGVAYAILGLAATSVDLDDAATLHGAADALFDQLSETLEPLEADLRGRDQSRLRATAGDARFSEAYAHGRTLTRADAITLALKQSE
jgi:predicted ATPase/class 3 adenylate cyclase